MKNLNIVFGIGYFFPDSYGGTEVYVYNLAIALINMGHECTVIAPTEKAAYQYDYRGVKVIRFTIKPFSRNETIGIEKPDNVAEISKIVLQLNPDIFHLHSSTTSLGLHHMLDLKRYGVNVIFSGHVPGILCPRGDMMKYGKTPCDGKVELIKCNTCLLSQRGVNIRIAKSVAWLTAPLKGSEILYKYFPLLVKPLTMQNFIASLDSQIDFIVAVCDWLKKALVINGLRTKKIAVVRQALLENSYYSNKKVERKKIRLGYIGRIDPLKGLHELIEVFCANDLHNLVLTIVGISTEEHKNYHETLVKESSNHKNIQWEGSLFDSEKELWFSNIDMLCIPSLCLETGPIVAMEAIDHSVPVLGRNLGGIKELVTERTGVLFNDIKELSLFLNDLNINKSVGVFNFGDIKDAVYRNHEQATDMLKIYNNVLDQ